MAEPIATIQQGQLKGLTDTTLDGETYYKFLGIPYAKPPIGSLRFKAPQPADSWTGLRDATKEGSPCINNDFLTQKTVGSEDCLNLNIFTKTLPNAEETKQPVMVFIHGGAFTMGSNSEQVHGAKYLLCEDVVLVTVNYRLGIFGFLSSDDLSLDVPGNAGLKDQSFALKWVQDNISSFNGDPKNVTIFGISAGGASVQFQILSPLSKGLFHKAIAQSGSALNPWAWGQKNIMQVVEMLETKVSSEKEALDILVNTDAAELFKAVQKLPDVLLHASKRRPFGPVIEKPHAAAFLTKNPEVLLDIGKFNQVPLITGLTSKEGLLWEFGSIVRPAEPTFEEIGMPWILGLEKGTEKYEKVKTMINDFYFKDGMTKNAIHELTGDVNFFLGIIESVKLAFKISRNPIYFYVLSYKALAGLWGKLLGVNEEFSGVSHGEDQGFLFSNSFSSISDLEPHILDDLKAGIKMMTKMWTDFARTGKPHPDWKQVAGEDDINYFDIDKTLTLKQGPFAERVQLWNMVLQESSGHHPQVQEKANM